ncbi:hypothetical protein [Cellulomonas rhizosphaerae]|uniref:Uncharacterized protein n=1 Tax=Cellulomonas rhizosphaerae TaxID=2293719 RepID=A0A413RNP8_9CELL|nr:hypothetical protein [Cellulomonas rhizosphaerae]RHA43639.1 hypothetical protein D1825_05310 [Cellulomonas rhizosphaerae]
MAGQVRTVVELTLGPDIDAVAHGPTRRPRRFDLVAAAGVGLVIFVLLSATPAAAPAARVGDGTLCVHCEPGSRYHADTFMLPRSGPQRMGSP